MSFSDRFDEGSIARERADSTFSNPSPEKGGESLEGATGLAMHRKTWTRDKDAKHCMSCGTGFTLKNRKHHCRSCGGVFCGLCTKHRETLQKLTEKGTKVRVCPSFFPSISPHTHNVIRNTNNKANVSSPDTYFLLPFIITLRQIQLTHTLFLAAFRWQPLKVGGFFTLFFIRPRCVLACFSTTLFIYRNLPEFAPAAPPIMRSNEKSRSSSY